MTPDKPNHFNLLIGLVLTALVTLPTLLIVSGDAEHPSFSVHNAWLWLAMLILLLCEFAIAFIGLRNKIHWGFLLWSQATLSLLVLVLYVGQYRRERNYAIHGDNLELEFYGPPDASLKGFLYLVLLWLTIGFAPLALMQLWLWLKKKFKGIGD